MSDLTATPESETDFMFLTKYEIALYNAPPISEVFNIFTGDSAKAGMNIKGIRKVRSAAKEFIRDVAQEIWTEVPEKGEAGIPNFCFDVDLVFVDAWRDLAQRFPYREWTYKDPVLYVVLGMKDSAHFGEHPRTFELFPDDYNYRAGDVLLDLFNTSDGPSKPVQKQTKPKILKTSANYDKKDTAARLRQKYEDKQKKAAQAARQAVDSSSATTSTGAAAADAQDGSASEQDGADELDDDATKKGTAQKDPINTGVAQDFNEYATKNTVIWQDPSKADSTQTSGHDVTDKDATLQNPIKTGVPKQDPPQLVTDKPTTHIQYRQQKAIIKKLATTNLTPSIITTEQDFWARAIHTLFPFMAPHETAARLLTLRNLDATSKNPNPWTEKWHSYIYVRNTLNCRLGPSKWAPILRAASHDWEMFLNADDEIKEMMNTVMGFNPFALPVRTPVTMLTGTATPKTKTETKTISPFPLAAPKKNPLAHHTSILQQPLPKTEAASKNIFASLAAEFNGSSDQDDTDDTPLTPLAASTKTKMSGLLSGKPKMPAFMKGPALSPFSLGSTSQVSGPAPFLFRTAGAAKISNPFAFGVNSVPVPAKKLDECLSDAAKKAFGEEKVAQPSPSEEQSPTSLVEDTTIEETIEDESTAEIEAPTIPPPEPSQILPAGPQEPSSPVPETVAETTPGETEIPTTPIQESSQPVLDAEQEICVSEETPIAENGTCTTPVQEPAQAPLDVEQQLSYTVEQATIEKDPVENEIPTTPVQKPSQPVSDAEQKLSTPIEDATVEKALVEITSVEITLVDIAPAEITPSSPVNENVVELTIEKALEQIEAPTAPAKEPSHPTPDAEPKLSSSASENDVCDDSEVASNGTGTTSPKQEPVYEPNGMIEDHLFEVFRRVAENEASKVEESDSSVEEDMVVPVEEKTVASVKEEAVVEIEEDAMGTVEEERVAPTEETVAQTEKKAISQIEEDTIVKVAEGAITSTEEDTSVTAKEEPVGLIEETAIAPVKETAITSIEEEAAKETAAPLEENKSAPAEEETIAPSNEQTQQTVTTPEEISTHTETRLPVPIPIEATIDTLLEVEPIVQSIDVSKEATQSTVSTKPLLSFDFEPLEDLQCWAKDTFGVEFAADRHVLQLDETPFREVFDPGFLSASVLDLPLDAVGVGDTNSTHGSSLLQQLEHTSLTNILFEELTGIKVPKEVIVPEIEHEISVSRGLVITSVSTAPEIKHDVPISRGLVITSVSTAPEVKHEIPASCELVITSVSTAPLEPKANVAPAKTSSISEQLDKMDGQLDISSIAPPPVDEAFAPTATDIFHPNHFTQFTSVLGTFPVAAPSKFRANVRLPRPTPTVRLPPTVPFPTST